MLLFTDGTYAAGPGASKTGSPQENEAIVLRSTRACPSRTSRGRRSWTTSCGLARMASPRAARPTLFCPMGPANRGQMATFLDRALDLPDPDQTCSPMTRASPRGRDQSCHGGRDHQWLRPEHVLPEEVGDASADGDVPRHAFGFSDTDDDFFTDYEGISARGHHQPHRGSRHHDGLWPTHVLPQEHRDPPADGGIPAPGDGRLTPIT